MYHDEQKVRRHINKIGKADPFVSCLILIIGIFCAYIVPNMRYDVNIVSLVKMPLFYTLLSIGICYLVIYLIDYSHKLSSWELEACHQYPWNTQGREVLKKQLNQNKPLNYRNIKSAWKAHRHEERRLRQCKKQEILYNVKKEEEVKREKAQEELKEKMNG